MSAAHGPGRAAADAPADAGASPDAVDFDLSGVVGVRLVGPAPADLSAARRVLGDPGGPLTRAPDIRVHFTPRLASGGLAWVEPGVAGFSDRGFDALRIGRRPTRTRVSFDAPDGGWELLCESGSGCFPLLIPMVRLAALRRNAIPLHAAAFVVEGRGVIASGWAHGGKTTALLSFVERGARYVADDWILLSEGGSRMSGMPGLVTISDVHARSPVVRRRGRHGRDVVRQMAGWAGRTVPRSIPATARGGALGKAAQKVGGALTRRAELRLEPTQLFGEQLPEATPHVLLLMMRHQGPRVSVHPMDADEAATRLACASGHEELPLLSLCQRYRFAFPGSAGVRFADEAPMLRERLLRQALSRIRAYVVRHPPDACPEALHAAMAPLLRGAL